MERTLHGIDQILALFIIGQQVSTVECGMDSECHARFSRGTHSFIYASNFQVEILERKRDYSVSCVQDMARVA